MEKQKYWVSVSVHLLALGTGLNSCPYKWPFFAILRHLQQVHLHSYHWFRILFIIQAVGLEDETSNIWSEEANLWLNIESSLNVVTPTINTMKTA